MENIFLQFYRAQKITPSPLHPMLIVMGSTELDCTVVGPFSTECCTLHPDHIGTVSHN